MTVFSVVDDASAEDAVRWSDTELVVRHHLGPQAFSYAPSLVREIDRIGPDLLHTHGLWMYPSVAASGWASRNRRPLVVSPHGMLDPWALRNSAWKKRIAAALFEDRHLSRTACLHALNESEYRAIRAYGLENPVAIIPNGIEPSEDSALPAAGWTDGWEGHPILLFLGRLHQKKGVDTLLDAWARVRHGQADACQWRLAIAGWGQSEYEATLRRIADDLQLGDTVRFVGPQFDAAKAASFAAADGFILPSISEGLPMAVLEAWSSRLPVLMTPQCNLPEGVEAGAAMEIAVDAEHMAVSLAAFFALSEPERLAIGERGRRLVADRFNWDTIAHEMRAVYSWILSGGTAPTVVRIN